MLFFPRGVTADMLWWSKFITVALWKAEMEWKAQDNTLSMKPGAIKYIKKEGIVLTTVNINFIK